MKKTINKRFSEELIQCLEIKYNKKPSAQFFAKNFNLKSNTSISKETARKWMNGISLPEPEKMKVLIEWLNLETNNIFNEKYKNINHNGITDPLEMNETEINMNLSIIINKLDNNSKRLMLITAIGLYRINNTNNET